MTWSSLHPGDPPVAARPRLGRGRLHDSFTTCPATMRVFVIRSKEEFDCYPLNACDLKPLIRHGESLIEISPAPLGTSTIRYPEEIKDGMRQKPAGTPPRQRSCSKV